MDYNLLQQHTVEIYDLKNHDCVIQRVSARTLLKPQRFDLFAKLYYIDKAESDYESAVAVYSSHIKAFNPDLREPGRDDKNGIQDFVVAFDALINQFKSNDFDESISIIPVDERGVILDGAHRVAALAYFKREVTIAKFDGVSAKCNFDYSYFVSRGLAQRPWEMTKWVDNLLVGCFWPRMGDDKIKNNTLNQLAQNHVIAYVKKMKLNMKSLTYFVGEIYKSQSWTLNQDAVKDKAMRVFGKKSKCLWLVFFENLLSIDDVIKEKEQIRNVFGVEKDSLHITDTLIETQQVANLTLLDQLASQWNEATRVQERFDFHDDWNYFKKVTWMNIKVRTWHLLHLNFKGFLNKR